MDMNPGFIERYQILFEKDKSTKSFAPLAEAYRRMNLLKEAKEVCEIGLSHHPSFTSGLVAYAKVLIDLESFDEAIKVLEKVTTQNPDNILAHNLLGSCYLHLKKHNLALRSFKMLLFLAPNHMGAQKQVKKLESLSAPELHENSFKILDPSSLFEEVSENTKEQESKENLHKLNIERVLSLADAFSVRGDLDKALNTLKSAREQLGDHPEIIKRLSVLDQQPPEISVSEIKISSGKKIARLEKALLLINQNRRD
ncbi:MAG: tetratricopeptide repeat protein [Bdellovibrionota bacterium]|nr:tetratricopeptide repeat protein [Bdellovibrionota bacterium]